MLNIHVCIYTAQKKTVLPLDIEQWLYKCKKNVQRFRTIHTSMVYITWATLCPRDRAPALIAMHLLKLIRKYWLFHIHSKRLKITQKSRVSIIRHIYWEVRMRMTSYSRILIGLFHIWKTRHPIETEAPIKSVEVNIEIRRICIHN
jgi:hypothetical protein